MHTHRSGELQKGPNTHSTLRHHSVPQQHYSAANCLHPKWPVLGQWAPPPPQASVMGTRKESVPVASPQKPQRRRRKVACSRSPALNTLGGLGASEGPCEIARVPARDGGSHWKR